MRLYVAILLLTTLAVAQEPNPFAPPLAKVQYAPDRTYDLKHLLVEVSADYPRRLITGRTTNTIVALRGGVTQHRFHAGNHTKIVDAILDGQPATFTRDTEGILVQRPASKKGQTSIVAIRYTLSDSDVPEADKFDGLHWHEPQRNDPSRIGFWTKGGRFVRDWAVTWDYPNDFATTETRTTVPADWDVIGNGLQFGDTKSIDGKTHTVTWRMTQPHATYLTSLVAGPLDIVKDNYRGLPLLYAAPRGPKVGSKDPDDRGYNIFLLRQTDQGKALAYTVSHTKAMLEFFESKLGVKYPWPKYAQVFTYDFNGGQENVSASSLGNFITNPRRGYFGSDGIISHELAHQWVGDLVTCRDWGEVWLNEGLAMFLESAWNRHSRGVDANMRQRYYHALSYIGESRGYQRPLPTPLYSTAADMFDAHSYDKGAVLLYSLMRLIGEDAFYSGLNRYLTVNRHNPVDTNSLCTAMTEAAGTNLRPWFDQWVYKPGHPILEWSWNWDESSRAAVVRIKQIQDATKGTPIYDTPLKIGFLSEAGIVRQEVRLNSADQEFRLPLAARPGAVLIDPDQEILREIRKQPWADAELPFVVRFAPNCMDRQAALNRLLATPSDDAVRLAVAVLMADRHYEPAFLQTAILANLKRADLRSFWESELKHANFPRRTQAVKALGMLPVGSATNQRLRALVNDSEPYEVVVAAMQALATVDLDGNRILIEQVAKTSLDSEVRAGALAALLEKSVPGSADLLFASLDENQPIAAQMAGFDALASFKGEDPRLLPLLRRTIASDDYYGLVFSAVRVASLRKMKELLPELRDLRKRTPFAGGFVDSAIATVESPNK